MKLYLTKGFGGDKIECLCEETHSKKKISKAMYDWSTDPKNLKKYKIESYSTYTLGDDHIIVDFGDYSTFMIICDMTKSDRAKFFN